MRLLCAIALLAGCSKSGSAPETKTTEPRPETGGAATEDPCSPAALKLPNAKLIPLWQPPAGCTVRGGDPSKIVLAESDVAASFDCNGTSLGIDFATTAIVVSTRNQSPALAGIFALDDGTTITFVNRFREPCPDDPQPMPAPPVTLLYKITGGTRAFGETTCVMKASCK